MNSLDTRAHMGGSINERGYIAGMNKKGFNGPRALGELSANSIDASASITHFDISKENIRIIDNGNGMTKEQLINMWDSQRENHELEIKTGVSGFGAKPSTKILSENTPVTLYTKSSNDIYLKALVPWDIITSMGQYTDMIEISIMTENEIKSFQDSYKIIDPLCETGTIIQFKYNSFIETEIMKQFHLSKTIQEPSQRLDCVFSKFKYVQFRCSHYETNIIKTMKMYSYFNRPDNTYYSKDKYNITVYKDGIGKYIYALPNGQGYQSYQKLKNWGFKDWVGHRSAKKIGYITITCGLRKDDKYFNYKNPVLPTGVQKLLSYEQEFFEENDEIKTQNWYPSPIRNDQYIGNIGPLPTFRAGGGRASGVPALKLNYIRTDVQYEVHSAQNNILDDLMGIQENKNQLNTHHLDESFKRLIEHCMKTTTENIWTHFGSKIREEEERKRQIKQEEIATKRVKEKLEKDKEEKDKEEKDKEEEDEPIEHEPIEHEPIEHEPIEHEIIRPIQPIQPSLTIPDTFNQLPRPEQLQWLHDHLSALDKAKLILE